MVFLPKLGTPKRLALFVSASGASFCCGLVLFLSLSLSNGVWFGAEGFRFLGVLGVQGFRVIFLGADLFGVVRV